MAPHGSDRTLAFLNAVADWADRRHVDVAIWRSDAPDTSEAPLPIADWRVTLNLRDSEGRFSATVVAAHPARGEGEEFFATRIGRLLDRACVEARRQRIEAYTRADPRRVRQQPAAAS
jgi:hypothetical protein